VANAASSVLLQFGHLQDQLLVSLVLKSFSIKC
jgi:hypothetical protein